MSKIVKLNNIIYNKYGAVRKLMNEDEWKGHPFSYAFMNKLSEQS